MLVADGPVTVKLAAEELATRIEAKITGRVIVETRSSERVEPVRMELRQDEVEIERVVLNRTVSAIPDIRQEGDVTIIPVVEEVLVVERRLILREEIRVHRVTRMSQHREDVVLRTQQAEIHRLPKETNAAGTGSAEDRSHKT